MFNLVNLILPYDPEPLVSGLWVFGVGLLLQSTYLALRYTVRFRNLRGKLVERGAEMYDVDQISKGQMTYLGQLVLGTSFISLTVYYLIPIMQDLFAINVLKIPYPHIVIGFTCTLLIAASIILYLRGWGKTTEAREIITQINKDLPNNLDTKNH